MKISCFAVSIMVAAMLASPLAYSAQGHGAQVTRFKSYNDSAFGCSSGTYYSCFNTYAYDDYSGQRWSYIEVSGYDGSGYYDIWCEGPTNADVISLNQGNGDSSVNATLDPSSANCSNYNVYTPVTLNVTGQYDGNYRYSNNGTSKEIDYGTNRKYNFQSDFFQETFAGTNGFYTGTFSGGASTEHRTQLTKVK